MAQYLLSAHSVEGEVEGALTTDEEMQALWSGSGPSRMR
jgi:hypothetical protein